MDGNTLTHKTYNNMKNIDFFSQQKDNKMYILSKKDQNLRFLFMFETKTWKYVQAAIEAYNKYEIQVDEVRRFHLSLFRSIGSRIISVFLLNMTHFEYKIKLSVGLISEANRKTVDRQHKGNDAT